MTITPVQLIAPQQLTNAAAIYYTSTNIRTRVDKMSFTNVDTANPHTVTVYLVPNGGSPGVTNIITDARSIAAKQTWNSPDMVGQILNPGDTIQALADASAQVVVSAAGVQIST